MSLAVGRKLLLSVLSLCLPLAPGGHLDSPLSFPSTNSRPLLPSKGSTSLIKARRNRQTCRTLGCAQTCTQRRTSPPRYGGAGRLGVVHLRSLRLRAPPSDPPVFPLQSKAAASATREWTEQETLLLLEVSRAREGEPYENGSGQGAGRTRGWGEHDLAPVSLLPGAHCTCPKDQLQARDWDHFVNPLSFLSATCRSPLDPGEYTNTTNQRALKQLRLVGWGC